MRKQKCMTPGCDNTNIVARGLCNGCYRSIARLVRLKRANWKTLEKRKLAKPARIGRPGGKAFEAVTGTR